MAFSKMRYFKQEDVLHLVITDESETNSVEIIPDFTAGLNHEGEFIGIEIINASFFLRNFPLPNAKQ